MICVVAALIENDNKVLIAKRMTGDESFMGKWEFPGGKVEKNESDKSAIEREIYEELGIKIKPEKLLTSIIYEYPTKTINIKLFKCIFNAEPLVLYDHSEIAWVSLKDILKYDMLPADIQLIENLKNRK